jgi:hypothetical protein
MFATLPAVFPLTNRTVPPSAVYPVRTYGIGVKPPYVASCQPRKLVAELKISGVIENVAQGGSGGTAASNLLLGTNHNP